MTSLWARTQKKERPVRLKKAAIQKGDTYFGKSLTIVGNISGGKNCHIDGSVKGDCDLKGSLKIGPTAHVEGDIRAVEINIGGRMEGSVLAQQEIHLDATARVNGSMRTSRLSIDDGAVFNGDMVMDRKSPRESGTPTDLKKPEIKTTTPEEKA